MSQSYFQPRRVVVVGAGGSIGSTFVKQLAQQEPVEVVYALSRQEQSFESNKIKPQVVDIHDESSLAHVADMIGEQGAIDTVIVGVGMLHDEDAGPEKSLKDLSADNCHKLFAVNTIAPALIAKHFVPLLPRKEPSVWAALSARVGSISDNRLGGWYAYRMSKAALNMFIKTMSIEVSRSRRHAAVVGLHPGTVDSRLSQPFQARVPEGKLFSPEYSVSQLLNVVQGLKPEDSGTIFAWDGQAIEF